MMITATLLLAVSLLGAFVGGVFLSHLSWKGVFVGAAGAMTVFGTLTGVLLLIASLVGPTDIAEAAPLQDTLSGVGLVSSLAGN